MLMLVVLFAAPLLTALTLRLSGWTPGGTDNHGILVEPPVALPITADSRLAEHWVLVFHAARSCGADCRSTLDALQRVHRGLGRDAHRVLLVWTAPAGVKPGGASLPDVSGAPWVAALGRAAPGGPRPNAVYLVDPRGYLALWYPPGFDASGLLEDLEKLLRYSRVGVQ